MKKKKEKTFRKGLMLFTCLRSMVMVTHSNRLPFCSVGLCQRELVPSMALLMGWRCSSSLSSHTFFCFVLFCFPTANHGSRLKLWLIFISILWRKKKEERKEGNSRRIEAPGRRRVRRVCSRFPVRCCVGRKWRWPWSLHSLPNWRRWGRGPWP